MSIAKDLERELRVETEELSNRIVKLEQFMNGDDFKSFSDDDRFLLAIQHHMMLLYSSVLDKRISKLNLGA